MNDRKTAEKLTTLDTIKEMQTVIERFIGTTRMPQRVHCLQLWADLDYAVALARRGRTKTAEGITRIAYEDYERRLAS